jgi:hypothetical protein
MGERMKKTIDFNLTFIYWVLTLFLEIYTIFSFFYYKQYFPLLAVLFIAMMIIAESSN